MKLGKFETHPAADIFPLMEGAEFEAFADDIQRRGLDNPIVIQSKGRGSRALILDGRNRWRACEARGIEPTFLEFEGKHAVHFIVAANLHRRHLDIGARAMIAARLAGLSQGEVKTSPEQVTQDEAATLLGVSERAVRRARAVLDGGVPEVIKAAEKGQIPIDVAAEVAKLPHAKQRALAEKLDERSTPGMVRNLVRAEGRLELAKELDAKPLPMPTGPYDVIATDPPWKFSKREGDATSRGHLTYPPMELDAICALPVAALAGPDSVLWMWTTNQHLLDGSAHRVLGAWGFEPVGIVTWDKGKLGLGDWLRNQTEHVIMAIRGRPTVTLSNQSTMLRGDLREHSRKPESFYELVESLCHGTKLEMFSRQARPGWALWGAEIEKFNAA